MPTFERGDMWSMFGKTSLFLVTTNPIRRKDGAVVMGRGIAKEFKDRYPEGPYDFGRKLDNPYVDNVGLIGKYDEQLVGFFMVKNHWKSKAEVSIIHDSVTALLKLLPVYTRIDLNFPGIGNGNLDRALVLEELKDLPNSVHIWEYANV